MEFLTLSPKGRRYGWKPQAYDVRDYSFVDTFQHRVKAAALPPVFTIPVIAPVYDQGDEGACTAFGGGAAGQALQMKLGKPSFRWAENFSYGIERMLEQTFRSDSGAEVRDFFVATTDSGFIANQYFPYGPQTLYARPSHAVKAAAIANRIPNTAYAAVAQDVTALKTALASGFGVVIGFNCFNQLESDQAAANGIVLPPAAGEASIGGHCVFLVGWDDTLSYQGVTGFFKFQNSWGTSWGAQGFGYLPQSYVANAALASDFWVFDAL